MLPPGASHLPAKNRLLAALPLEEYRRLLPRLELVHLAEGRTIYAAGETARYAYFMVCGMASLLSMTEDGEIIEVATAGSEGLIGIPIILNADTIPYQVITPIAGQALRITPGALREEFNRGGQLRELLLRYTHSVFIQIAQSSACGRFHSVGQRLAGRLLLTRDHASSDTFNLTQEFLSLMLGVPRTSVTTTANAIQRAGLIRYRRGTITILDRGALEESSCECYRNFRA